MKIKSLLSVAVLGTLAAFSAHAAQSPADMAAAKPDPNGNLIGLKTDIGKAAYNFIDLWFNQHKQSEAWDTYVARKGYMNHSVFGANTKTANRSYEEEKAAEAGAGGNGTHFDIKQLIAQGNLVFVHVAATRTGGAPAGAPPANGDAMGAAPMAAPAAGAAGMSPGAAPAGGMGAPPADGASNGDGAGPRELVMVLRFKNGKVVDHWDLHVATNSDSVVFAGLDRDIP
jgi:predicted SnoaL-like aldol condensation-catalyzing enzyme